MRFLLRLILNALLLIGIAYLVSGVEVDSFEVALLAALVFGIVNVIIKPIVHILSLPITILSLGLSIFIINAALFWLVALIVQGFNVEGFVPALIGALVMSVGSWLIGRIAKKAT